jgi:methylenetetrahydrofolate reductase (NADPH)
MDTALSQRMTALLRKNSIELSPRDAVTGEALRGLFDPGTTVFVNFPSSVGYADVVAACARLRRVGFEPVPHVVARRLESFADAGAFLQRLVDEADVLQIRLPATPKAIRRSMRERCRRH